MLSHTAIYNVIIGFKLQPLFALTKVLLYAIKEIVH
jgi:hypothetical protein